MEDVEATQPASPRRVPDEPQVSSSAVVEKRISITDSAEEQPQSAEEEEEEEEGEEEQEEEEEDTHMSSPTRTADENVEPAAVPASSPVQLLGNDSPEKSPVKSSPRQPLPEEIEQPDVFASDQRAVSDPTREVDAVDDNDADVTRSPSEGSSPIRPLVRKSSLSFASLPAREPLTSNKSLGARMSRVSHIEQTRTSYYPRHTGGKSLGVRQDALDIDQDAMDVDEDDAPEVEEKTESALLTHNKTYTQRLQDQISMLGKSQASGTRPSKSIPNLTGTQQSLFSTHSQVSQVHSAVEDKLQSPTKPSQSVRTPGAFHDDDEDDWIAPPTTKQTTAQSLRPAIGKSYSADIMEGVHGKDTVGSVDFDLSREQPREPRLESPRGSPYRPLPAAQQTKGISSHTKSVSVPELSHPSGLDSGYDSLRKVESVSYPSMETFQDAEMTEAPKSPATSLRESPLKSNALKQVKSKFSSILKGSKSLLASGAALSAEGKASMVNSPSTTRLHMPNSKSTSAESILPEKEVESLYPDLTKHMSSDPQPGPSSSSPSRSYNRKTRASIERERREQKEKDKAEKEMQHLSDQTERLEEAREKERERARIFNKEQHDKVATEKQVASQKEHEKFAQTPAPKDVPRPTRTSPRKARAQPGAESKPAVEYTASEAADQDFEMADVLANKPAPPSIPRPTPGQSLRHREIKRPIKPTKDATVKSKQAPTLIRVNTSSQNTGFHPSNSALAATLQDTLGGPQQQTKSKPSQSSVQPKPSLQSLKNSVNSTSGRPKALEMAAKRKQQEEKEAQRRRDLKAEMERRREEDRRQEGERREKERQKAAADAEAKKIAERQAAIEKAKQTRAPPPAVRSQPNGPPEYNTVRDKAAIPRPPSRLQQSMAHRSQEDIGRPVNTVLSGSVKMAMKRPLQQEGAEDGSQRTAAPRIGLSQQKEVKRMRLSDEFDLEEEMEIQSYGTNIKGPPVRPSAGFKKVNSGPSSASTLALYSSNTQDPPNKSLFSSGYAPASQGVTRDIFKAPVASHHTKSGHPLDMAQVSKGHIPFAPSQQAAGPSYKTPARPAGVAMAKSVAKSATRSSPRFQNGENIELPDIETEDEDDEDESRALGQASWADTPELRRELMKQEMIDPLQVFGPPAPLKLEEIFKNKERMKQLKHRSSSANWNGTDRLTEEEIRKDIAARERMRRDGGWSYELSKDMA